MWKASLTWLEVEIQESTLKNSIKDYKILLLEGFTSEGIASLKRATSTPLDEEAYLTNTKGNDKTCKPSESKPLE